MQAQERNEWKMGERCKSRACRQSGKRARADISEEQRKLIYEKFWSEMRWDQRKAYIANNVNKIIPKRR